MTVNYCDHVSFVTEDLIVDDVFFVQAFAVCF
jgi:hypothetical protein